MLQAIQSKLTYLYGKLRGGITRTGQYSVSDVSRHVYWFEENSRQLGHTSPFGTIMLNEDISEILSEDAVDYVFLHEVGHTRNGALYQASATVILTFLMMASVAAVLVLPRSIELAFDYAGSLLGLVAYLFIAFAIPAAVVALFAAASWYEESQAEVFAISKIGMSEYRSVIEEMDVASDRGRISKLWYHVRYPPRRFIIWWARRRLDLE